MFGDPEKYFELVEIEIGFELGHRGGAEFGFTREPRLPRENPTLLAEKFQNFGGLNLATEHNFNGKSIRLADIKVIAK